MANLATCLYRMGKSVVILDLDIESPGLPPKFGHSVFNENSRVRDVGGVVSYIRDLVQRYIAGRSRDFQPLSLENYTILVGEKDEGRLQLIPTGSVNKQYRSSLAEEDWLRFAQTAPLRERVQYLDTVAKAVESLGRPGKPVDYLFVDLGCGLSRLATAVFAAWAGPILLFFSMDQENREGTIHILNEIWGVPGERDEARLDRNQPIGAFPILSRPGPFISDHDTLQLQKQASAALDLTELQKRKGLPIEYSDVLYLRSDPDLEREWHLHFQVDDEPINVALTRDYLRILAVVLPEFAPELNSNQRFDLMRQHLGIPARVGKRHKFFRLGKGVLVNMSDNERNVSFKVQTFCSILDDIHREIIDDEKTSGSSDANVNPIRSSKLKDAGLISGRRFAESVIKLWSEQNHDPHDLKGLLKYWCDFDSDVGFGSLTGDLEQRGVHLSGTVVVENNFLAEDRTDRDPDLCKLLAGYIEGVLENLFSTKIDIRHDKPQCMRTTSRDDCEFSFASRPQR